MTCGTERTNGKIAAARASDVPIGVRIAGATLHRCVRCKAEVIVTPATDRMIEEHGHKPWCLNCIQETDPGAVGVMTEGQKEDTRRLGVEPPEGVVPIPRI